MCEYCNKCSVSPSGKDVLNSVCGVQITYSYEGAGHELRNDQAALDYCFMLPHSDDSRLFHIDALASMTASGEVQLLKMYPHVARQRALSMCPATVKLDSHYQHLFHWPCRVHCENFLLASSKQSVHRCRLS